jgi:AraC-like DNA-binding protein
VSQQTALRWSGRVPLQRHPAFATDDPEVAVAHATGLLAPHRLRLPAGPAGFAARVNARRWDEVMLAYFRYGAELEVTAVPLAEIYAVNLSLTGHAEVRYRGAEISTGPSNAVVFSVTDASSMRWSSDHGVLCVTVRRAALERHLGRMLGRPISGPIRFEPDMRLAGPGASWSGVVQLLLRAADGAAAGTQSPWMTAELEQTVMTTLLLAQPHDHSELLLSEQPAPSDRIVDRADEIMRSGRGRSATVAAIAEQVGVSERALQLAFRRRLGRSPSEHLRMIRLDGARRQLLGGTPDGRTIGRVAADWGFPHLGRFAATYRKQYGEYPSETLRRARV